MSGSDRAEVMERMFQALNRSECGSIQIHHANADFNGMPNYCVTAHSYTRGAKDFRDGS